jgi:hypothetical protein
MKHIKALEKAANELKKSANNLSCTPPSATKIQLLPSWFYKKVILLLHAKTNMGAKFEKDFTALDKLNAEYESWRGKTLTEDNEEEFIILVDSLKGALYDLADTLWQIAQNAREELSDEKPAETWGNATSAKGWGITILFKNIIEKGWQIFTKSFWDSVFERWGPK